MLVDIKRYRLDKRILQREIAEALGSDQTRISKYESGRQRSVKLSDAMLRVYPDSEAYMIPEDYEAGSDHLELSNSTPSSTLKSLVMKKKMFASKIKAIEFEISLIVEDFPDLEYLAKQ